MSIEVHPGMENSNDDDADRRGPEEQDMRADRELAISGANLVAGKSAAWVFRYRHRGALNVVQICFGFVEAESFD